MIIRLFDLLYGSSKKYQCPSSTLNIHWKDWCWNWSTNISATWYEELIHWKRPWYWERLRARGEKGWQRMRWWDGALHPVTIALRIIDPLSSVSIEPQIQSSFHNACPFCLSNWPSISIPSSAFYSDQSDRSFLPSLPHSLFFFL